MYRKIISLKILSQYFSYFRFVSGLFTVCKGVCVCMCVSAGFRRLRYRQDMKKRKIIRKLFNLSFNIQLSKVRQVNFYLCCHNFLIVVWMVAVKIKCSDRYSCYIYDLTLNFEMRKGKLKIKKSNKITNKQKIKVTYICTYGSKA